MQIVHLHPVLVHPILMRSQSASVSPHKICHDLRGRCHLQPGAPLLVVRLAMAPLPHRRAVKPLHESPSTVPMLAFKETNPRSRTRRKGGAYFRYWPPVSLSHFLRLCVYPFLHVYFSNDSSIMHHNHAIAGFHWYFEMGPRKGLFLWYHEAVVLSMRIYWIHNLGSTHSGGRSSEPSQKGFKLRGSAVIPSDAPCSFPQQC